MCSNRKKHPSELACPPPSCGAYDAEQGPAANWIKRQENRKNGPSGTGLEVETQRPILVNPSLSSPAAGVPKAVY